MADRGARGDRRFTLAVMAKAPIPGYAKTRLIPRLGPKGAAELQALLAERTVRAALASGFDAVAIWCAPSRRWPFFARLGATGAVELRDQPEGDLGARMRAAFEAHLGAGPVLMVGTDCPELTPSLLAQGRAALAEGADAVLLPAVDGGYAAIGLSRLDAALFSAIPWSTAEVMAVTRARLRLLGWSARELSTVRDVDLPEDLDWLLAGDLLDPLERRRLELHLP